MGRPFIFDMDDFTGGLNLSAPEKIADNEVAALNNFTIEANSIVRRPGRSLVATYSEEILSIARYRPSFDTVETTLLGCASSIARVTGTTAEALQIADGRIYPTLTYRWWFEQYGDEMFWCRRGNGGIKRIYGTSIMEGGIQPPTVAPIVTDGGPGKMIAGDGPYLFAYRYFNTITGARSNWSPVSKPLALLDNHQAYMSGIGISTNQQVNARQIGASLPNDPVIRLVGQINDNTTTTTYVNVLAPTDYGEADVDPNGVPQTDTRNGPPPDQAWALAVYKERLFVLNGDGLFWSEPGLMQSFKPTSFIPVKNGTGLIPWERHGLVILCEGEGKILIGDTPDDWTIETFSREHGCPAGKSASIADGVLFWYTGENIVASSGSSPKILTKIEWVTPLLDQIPEASKSDVVGETIPGRRWYVLSLPLASSRALLVYDYQRDCFEQFPSGPKALSRFMRTTKSETVNVAFAGDYSLYDYLTGTQDSGSPISASIKTKKYGEDNKGMMKLTRRVNILCPSTAGTIQLKVYHDDVEVENRTGLSLSAEGWKRFNVFSSTRPGTHVQVEVLYSGTPELRIDRMQIEGVLLVGRRPKPV